MHFFSQVCVSDRPHLATSIVTSRDAARDSARATHLATRDPARVVDDAHAEVRSRANAPTIQRRRSRTRPRANRSPHEGEVAPRVRRERTCSTPAAGRTGGGRRAEGAVDAGPAVRARRPTERSRPTVRGPIRTRTGQRRRARARSHRADRHGPPRGRAFRPVVDAPAGPPGGAARRHLEETGTAVSTPHFHRPSRKKTTRRRETRTPGATRDAHARCDG
jgi:hypothetical protein